MNLFLFSLLLRLRNEPVIDYVMITVSIDSLDIIVNSILYGFFLSLYHEQQSLVQVSFFTYVAFLKDGNFIPARV